MRLCRERKLQRLREPSVKSTINPPLTGTGQQIPGDEQKRRENSLQIVSGLQ